MFITTGWDYRAIRHFPAWARAVPHCFVTGDNESEDELEALPPPPIVSDADANTAMRRYFDELSRTHERNNRRQARFREQLRDAQALAATAPPEGGVALTPQQAKDWAAYQALGQPAELSGRLTERDTLAGEVAATKQREHLAAVAQAAGFKPTVLAKFYGDRSYELRDSQDADGKAVKVAYIKDGDVMKPLAEYAAAQWADELPALQASAAQAQAPAFPPQASPQGVQGGGDRVAAFLERRNKLAADAPNPLAPAVRAAG